VGTAARCDGDGRAARRHGGGPGDAASDRGGRDARCRGGGARGETTLSGRCAVPTALLTRGSYAACGSHAATARFHAGPARGAVSDRWGPLVSVF
jgi:hypothetical protein